MILWEPAVSLGNAPIAGSHSEEKSITMYLASLCENEIGPTELWP